MTETTDQKSPERPEWIATPGFDQAETSFLYSLVDTAALRGAENKLLAYQVQTKIEQAAEAANNEQKLYDVGVVARPTAPQQEPSPAAGDDSPPNTHRGSRITS